MRHDINFSDLVLDTNKDILKTLRGKSKNIFFLMKFESRVAGRYPRYANPWKIDSSCTISEIIIKDVF